jgi:sporulation protein YlmC with PRC-barrel domain
MAAGAVAQTEPVRDQTNQPPPKQNDNWQDRQPGIKDKDNKNDKLTCDMSAKRLELVPASSAIGTNVYGSDGEKIGDVNDIVISRTDGRIVYALVGRGGVLGVGEKVVPVPYSALGWDTNKKAFTLPISKERMKEAPTLDRGEWVSLADSSKSESVYRFFNVQRDIANADDQAYRTSFHSNLPADQKPLLRVSEIKGKKLMADDGRDLGRVEEIVYDASSGRVAFAVVTFGGALGLGEDKVAVPWTLLDVNRDGRLVAVGLDKEKVRSAPRLTSRDWQELRDPAFASRVYSHYGQHAAWLDRQITASDTREPWATEYDRMYNDGKSYQITGAVEGIEMVTPVQGAPEIMTIVIKSESGEVLEVQLAPRNYLDGENIGIKEGDRVTAHGRLVERDGKRQLIATDMTPASGRSVTLRNSDGSSIWRR